MKSQLTLSADPARSVLLALFVAMSVTACGRMHDLQERVDYWTTEQTQFFRGLVTIDDIHPWLRERGVIYTFEDGDLIDGSWTVTLEKVYPDAIRCEWVDIDLIIDFDELGRVQSTYIDFEDACWW